MSAVDQLFYTQNGRILLTAMLALVTLLVVVSQWWNKLGSPARVPALIVVGPTGAGKTSLFYRWIGHTRAHTVTSIAPNEQLITEFPVDSDDKLTLRVVDLPGHPKLDQFVIDELQRKDAKIYTVVFVMDASSGETAIAQVAARLYKVLEHTEPRGIRVLVAANKIDLFSALSAARIRKLLEAHITELRQSQSKSVGDAGVDDFEAPIWLGADTPEFHFTDLESEVEVVEGSVKQGRTQKWEEWISRV